MLYEIFIKKDITVHLKEKEICWDKRKTFKTG